jgi:WD40 repeat protein
MLQTHTPGAATERGALRPRARGHVEDVFCCALSPDGQQVASGVDRTIRLWDADGRQRS